MDCLHIKLKYLFPALLISMVIMQLVYFTIHGLALNKTSVLLDRRHDIMVQMTRLQGTINFLLRTGNPTQANEEISSFAADTSLQNVLLFDADKRVLASIRRTEIGQAVPVILEKQNTLSPGQFQEKLNAALAGLTGQVWENHHGRYSIGLFPINDFSLTTSLRSNRYGGLLMIQDNRQKFTETEVLVWQQSLHMGAVTILIAIFIGFLLHMLITRKTERLMALTESYSTGNHRQRYGLQGNTELDYLGHAFDLMAEKLTDIHAHMETIIEARTRDLYVAKQEAEQANRVKSDFLRHMSHELRTPLNAIIGFSQLLENEDLTKVQAEYLSEILVAGNRLLILITRILDLFLLERDMLELTTERVLLKDMLVGVQNYFSRLAGERGIKLDWTCRLDHQKICVDPVRVHQVLHELLTNALKFTDEGGTVVFDASSDGKQINFTVKDTGAGMNKAELKQITAPFERLHSRPGIGDGIGIGLNLCQQLLLLMGSKLHIESQPGQGSCFCFSLPLDSDRQ